MLNHSKQAIVALLLPALVGWQAVSASMELEPSSRLWVTGTSSVRGFECEAVGFEASVASQGSDAIGAVLSGSKSVDNVEVTIAAGKLDCRNGTMNGHMLKAIKATEHPTITFRLSSYELAQASDSMKVSMTGKLSLGGVERDITLDALAAPAPDNTLRVTGIHDLSMKDYGLKPPSLMLGTMKVHDKVKVHFDLILKN